MRGVVVVGIGGGLAVGICIRITVSVRVGIGIGIGPVIAPGVGGSILLRRRLHRCVVGRRLRTQRHGRRGEQGHAQHRQRRGGAQARSHPPQRHFHVPGFELGAPVEVQAEAGADEERFDQGHRQPGDGVEADVRPHRGLLADQRPGRARGFRQQVDGHEQEDRGDAGQAEHAFERGEDAGHQQRMAVDRPAQGAAALALLAGARAFQQFQRHEHAARRTQPTPGQVADQGAPAPGALRAHGVAHARHVAEHRARDHEQRDPVQHRLQPPQQQRCQPQRIDRPGAEVEHGEQRQGDQQPGLPDRPGVAADQGAAQFHRFPGRACAQHHVQALNPHRWPPRGRARRATATSAPASRVPPTRCT
ncbi:hypothetical protein NB705_003652 [Xanthomonas sacchari]|nr:hypothetical protein [Xanthomonas sacchari]